MAQKPDAEDSTIVLGLLEAVADERARSQRHLAAELGIALGLANAYIRRCVRKGLVKVTEAPASRYYYYLTPKGFAEKSRLTIRYLTASLSFFRQARSDFSAVFQDVSDAGHRCAVLAGASELAEVGILCALEFKIKVAAIVDPFVPATSMAGVPVVADYDLVSEPFDVVVVTDMRDTGAVFTAARERVGAARVRMPRLLKRVLGPELERAER